MARQSQYVLCIKNRGYSAALEPGKLYRLKPDEVAHKTLSLRALFRSFPEGKVPDCYYDYVRGQITRDELFSNPDVAEEGKQALREARCAELGKTPHQTVDAWIRRAVGDAN